MNVSRRLSISLSLRAAFGILMLPGLLCAEDQVLLREPAATGEEVISNSTWLRLGGGNDAGLRRDGEELVWKTRAQSVILHQFTTAELQELGARIELNVKARLYGAPSQNSFQIGLFNSTGEVIPGDQPEGDTRPEFVSFVGYFAAFSLHSTEPQGIVLYRRKAKPETPDAGSLFSLNASNAEYLKASQGYQADAEELEFIISVEKSETGVNITVSVNGLSFQASDSIPVTSFDTVALLCFGDGMEEVVVSRCEITR